MDIIKPIKLYDIKNKTIIESKDFIKKKVNEYFCLSHVWKIHFWGCNINDENIICKCIYKKMEEASKASNLNFGWCDQICIDQENINEKEKEIPKMGQYYKNAKVVVTIVDNMEDVIFTKNKENLKIISKHSCEEIISLLDKCTLVSRAWCFQEISMASKVLILNNINSNIDMESLLKWIFFNDHDIIKIRFRALLETILGCFHIPEISFNASFDEYLKFNKKLNLYELLNSTKRRNSYFEEDRIYSIIGLLNIKLNKVSYGIGWHKALCNIINEAFIQNNDTSILSIEGILCKKKGLCWLPGSLEIIKNPSTILQPRVQYMHASVDGINIYLKKGSYLLIECKKMYASGYTSNKDGIENKTFNGTTYYKINKNDKIYANNYMLVIGKILNISNIKKIKKIKDKIENKFILTFPYDDLSMLPKNEEELKIDKNEFDKLFEKKNIIQIFLEAQGLEYSTHILLFLNTGTQKYVMAWILNDVYYNSGTLFSHRHSSCAVKTTIPNHKDIIEKPDDIKCYFI